MSINLSINEATEGALLATLAYKEYESSLLQRYPDAVIIRNKNARAVLIEHPDYLDVLFAGSDDYKDWMGNILRNKVPRDGIGEVYKGVADYYSLLQAEIHKNISDPMKPQRVLGHSLGGACAEMYAARRVLKGKPVKCLHTYGAPMVGNDDFCKASVKIEDAHNWWIKGDVVPYQPQIAGMISIGYSRARKPHVVDGLKVTDDVPFWMPDFLRWARKGIAHSCFEGYYRGLNDLKTLFEAE